MSAVPSECTEANRPLLSSLLLSRLSHPPVLTPIVCFPSCPFPWQRGGSCLGRLSHPPLQGPPVAPSQRRNSGPSGPQASHTRGHPLGDPGSFHSTCSGAPPCPWASLIHPSGLFSSATPWGFPCPSSGLQPLRCSSFLLTVHPPQHSSSNVLFLLLLYMIYSPTPLCSVCCCILGPWSSAWAASTQRLGVSCTDEQREEGLFRAIFISPPQREVS